MKHSSIHLKVFFSFAAILLCSVLITAFFGNSIMEWLYINSKSDDLSNAYRSISVALDKQQDPLVVEDTLMECFFEIEQNNINILMFTRNDNHATMQYFSRPNWTNDTFDTQFPFQRNDNNERTKNHPVIPSAFRFEPHQWIENAASLGIFDNAHTLID